MLRDGGSVPHLASRGMRSRTQAIHFQPHDESLTGLIFSERLVRFADTLLRHATDGYSAICRFNIDFFPGFLAPFAC